MPIIQIKSDRTLWCEKVWNLEHQSIWVRNEEKIETLYVINSSSNPRCPYPNPSPISNPHPHPPTTTLPWAHLRGLKLHNSHRHLICIVKKTYCIMSSMKISLSEILKNIHKRIPFIIYAGSYKFGLDITVVIELSCI